MFAKNTRICMLVRVCVFQGVCLCLYVCIRFVFVQFVIMGGYENGRLAIIVSVTTTTMLDENASVDT